MATEVYESILSGTLAGQFTQIVQHWSIDTTGSPPAYTTAGQLAEYLNGSSAYIELLMAALPADYFPTSLRCRQIAPTGGPTFIIIAANLIETAGQRTGEISSAQVSPLIIWVPSIAPNKLGRTFLPGITETDISEMKPNGTIIGLWQAWITFCITTGILPTSSFPVGLCILRRSSNNGDPVFDGYVSPLIGTQRRRLHPI